jgi:tripartite-type tricarboxylate transporter receptor subunit TctC
MTSIGPAITRRSAAAGLLGTLAAPRRARAQERFPTHPVKLVVALAPGGPTDVVARLLAPKLSDAWSQPVVVENRPGAGQTIGTAAVARSAPDGHTLLLSTNTMAVNPWLFRNIPYDTTRDLAPVMLISTSPLVLAVHPSVPARSVQELIALAKSKPDELNYASGGASSSPRMAAELLKSMAGIRMVHVGYNGSGPVTTALLSGVVQVAFVNPVFHEHFSAGRLRALAVTSTHRQPSMPDVPTMAEAGLPGYVAGSWFGLVAPAGTPPPVIERINRDFAATLRLPDVQVAMARQDQEVIASSPAEFASFIAEELARWQHVVTTMGLRVD